MSTNVLNLWTNQVGNGYCPQVKLEVWITSEDATKVYYDWYMYYVTYGYAAYTNGYSRTVTATVGGDTLTGSININGVTGTKLINSGSSWLSKLHSTRTVSCSVSFAIDVTWNGTYAASTSGSGSFTIGQQTSYTVSYNANGGSGAPGSQIKWHGENLTLSSTTPTRTGHSFKNWNTASDGTGTTYVSGASYTGNAALTLYAQWTADTYTVEYDANGGSGAPSSQTKTYGVDLTLLTTKPTRTNYNFLGWSTSSTAASAQYISGGKYTDNAAVTLYAVWELAYWKPKVTNLSAARCTSSGTADDFNTYAKVTFNYELCQLIGSNTPKTITIGYKLPTASSYTNTTVTATATSGTISKVIGGSLDINNSYDILVTVTDTKDGSTSLTTTIGSSAFPIDILKNDKGVAFGKAADKEGFECAWPAAFDDTLDVGGAVTFDSTLDVGGAVALDSTLEVGDSVTIPNAKHYYGCNTSGAARSLALINSSGNTYFGNGSYANSEGSTYYQGSTVGIQSKGNIYMTSPTAGISARAYGVNKVLWSGGAYMNASQTATLSEAVSAQPHGIVLVWSWYSGGTSNSCFRHFFVPKHQVSAHSSCGVDCARIGYDGNMAKYVYLYDTKITGHSLNAETNTTGGCTYINGNFVLRYVIGV